MKTLFLFILSVFIAFTCYSQEQHINVGTSPNDHTGDAVRDAFVKCDHNFDELYTAVAPNAIYLGPMAGTKYASLRKAVKKFGTTSQYIGSFYHLTKFVNGIFSGGAYHYEVDISLSPTIEDTRAVVMSMTTSSLTAKTGFCNFRLNPTNNSQLTGDITIDVSQLTLGSTSTTANFSEGGLFAINIYPNVGSGGGPTPIPITEITSSFTADGSIPLYLFNGSTGQTMTIDSVKNIVGNIMVKNLSTYDLTVVSAEGLPIDGFSSYTLKPSGSMIIIADSSKFEVLQASLNTSTWTFDGINGQLSNYDTTISKDFKACRSYLIGTGIIKTSGNSVIIQDSIQNSNSKVIFDVSHHQLLFTLYNKQSGGSGPPPFEGFDTLFFKRFSASPDGMPYFFSSSSANLGHYSFPWDTTYTQHARFTALSGSGTLLGLDGSGNLIKKTAGANWSLNGNSGTTRANFIGTTDTVPLIFRIYNKFSGIIDSVYRTTSFGYRCAENNTGIRNVAFGSFALQKNIDAPYNSAFGDLALSSAVHNGFNTAVGQASLQTNNSGVENVAFGEDAMQQGSTGNYNTAIGSKSLNHVTSDYNTAVGQGSMFNVSSGQTNTGIGYNVLFKNTTGSGNVTIGMRAGYYEIGSNKLIIHNDVGGRDTSLIYGIFPHVLLQFNSDTTQIKNYLSLKKSLTTSGVADSALWRNPITGFVYMKKLSSGSTGTVTSIGIGNGLSSTQFPLTTTGTIKLDTTIAETKILAASQLAAKWNKGDTISYPNLNAILNLANGPGALINNGTGGFSYSTPWTGLGYLTAITGTNLDNIWSSNGLLTRTGSHTYSYIPDNSSTWNALVTFPGFGTSGSTAAVGNDSRINNGQTAYGWGNPSGVYAPIAQTFYLGSTSIAINRGTGSQSLTGITSIDGTANIAGGTQGAIPYQTGANATGIVAATATANKALFSGASAIPTWSAYTLPSTVAAGAIFGASSTSAVGTTSAPTATYDILFANSSGIPTWSPYTMPSTVATGNILIATSSSAMGATSTLPSATNATTQTKADNSTKIATTAYTQLYSQPLYATPTALTPSGSITWTPVLGTNIYTLTPNATGTIAMGTIPGGCVGSIVQLVVTTSGSSSYTITFSTNLKSQGTLSTGTSTGMTFVINYLIYSTTSVIEMSRTTAM